MDTKHKILEAAEKKDTRNYGIDLLRIVAMMMVPILHILGQGGVIEATPKPSAAYNIEWILETAAYCSINCYAIISGYVGYGAKHKYSNLMYITLQVIFYLLGVSVVFAVLRPGSVGVKDFIKACIPFGFEAYWYFSAYFCMFFFIPYLNLLMEKLEYRQASWLMVLIIIMFSVLPTVFCRDLFGTNEGYCVLWITLLYMIGAYIKKYRTDERINGWKCLAGYALCVCFAWGFKMIFINKSFNLMFISYTSPAILGASVFLFLYFSKLKIKGFWKKIIGFFAPVSFGVYLLHVEPLVWNNIMYQGFAWIALYGAVKATLLVVAMALAIWLAGSLVDRVRLELFKLLHVRKLCEKAESALRKKMCRKSSENNENQ